MQANETNERVSFETTINDKRVIKSFIPVDSEQPYVIGLVTDYQIIQDVLNKQLLNHATSSLILLFIVLCANYFLSQYLVKPIHHILKKVNEISNGKFGTYIHNDPNKLFRIGGEVFTLILPNATQKSAENKVNIIIHQFAPLLN